MTAPSRKPGLEELDDYLSSEMGDDEAAAFEEAIFSAAAEGATPELDFVDALRRAFEDLAHRGSIQITLTLEQAKTFLETTPVRARLVDLDAYQGDPEADLAQLDIVLLQYRMPLAGVERVDVEFSSRVAEKMFEFPEVTFDAKDDSVILCCEVDLMRQSMAAGAIMRFYSVKGDERRLLREYGASP